MRTRSFLCSLIGLGFFSLIFLVPISGNAALYSTDLGFETSGQNMWGGGSSVTISDTYSEGLSWDKSFSVNAIIGGETVLFPGGCLPSWLGGCWDAIVIDTTTGAELSAGSDGYIGIEAGYSIYSGSINASYPVAVELTFPDPSTVSPGETFTISSQYVVDPSSGFDTNFAEIEAYVDVVADVKAQVDAVAYVAGNEILNISKTLIDQEFRMEVVGFNRDGDGNLSILGDHYPLGEEFDLTKYTDMKVTIPDIGTTSEESSPDSDTYTSSTGEKEFLSMGWDLDTMSTQAIYNLLIAAGVPASAISAICPDSFLAGDLLGFIYYDILDIDLGLEWDIMQSFLWEPELMIELATSNGEEYTFAAGDSIELEMPDSGFDITPTFVLNNTFTNDTDLAIVPEIELTYLDFSIPLFDLYVGPYPTDGPLELPIDIFSPINVYNGSFPLGFDPFTMASFSIVPSTGPGTEPVPEPATMLLLGSGLIGLAAFRRRRKQVIN